MSKSLTVEIWSDLICPMCWMGKRRFERALAAFPHGDRVHVVHRAFRLQPGALPPQPVEQMMARRFGSAADVSTMLKGVEQAAAGEGLTYHLSGTLVGDTLDAHRLMQLAAAKGVQAQAIERFYRAYFTEGLSLFDRETQLRLAKEAGLDRAAAAAVLDGDAYLAEVEADQRRAQALGANGVPFFLIGGRLAVTGAQPSETFLAALTKAWDATPAPVPQAEAAEICGPDGCPL